MACLHRFDDGPNMYSTPILLDILKKHSVRATFFFVGGNIDDEEILQRIVREVVGVISQGLLSFLKFFFVCPCPCLFLCLYLYLCLLCLCNLSLNSVCMHLFVCSCVCILFVCKQYACMEMEVITVSGAALCPGAFHWIPYLRP